MHVADDAEIRELEDRRIRVLVDRDDHPGALHADLVLDRARDAARDVELRRHRLAGLANLGRVRVPAGVDDRARRADRTAQRLRELFHEREVLRAAEPAAAGDDHRCVLDRRAFALLVRLVDHPRRRGEVFERDRCILHFRGAAGGVRVERAGAEERDPRLGLPADVHVDGILQRGPLADELAVLLHEVAEVPVEAGVEPGGKSGGDICGEHRVAEQHRVDALVAHELREHVDARLRQRRLELRVVGDVDLRGAELSRFVGERAHAGADDDAGDLTSPSVAAFASTPSDPFSNSSP